MCNILKISKLHPTTGFIIIRYCKKRQFLKHFWTINKTTMELAFFILDCLILNNYWLIIKYESFYCKTAEIVMLRVFLCDIHSLLFILSFSLKIVSHFKTLLVTDLVISWENVKLQGQGAVSDTSNTYFKCVLWPYRVHAVIVLDT